jgi:hypothetical protein
MKSCRDESPRAKRSQCRESPKRTVDSVKNKGKKFESIEEEEDRGKHPHFGINHRRLFQLRHRSSFSKEVDIPKSMMMENNVQLANSHHQGAHIM